MTRDIYMPVLHLKQPGFTKHHERIQKFRETYNLKHLYRNESDKACFAHDSTYSDSKDLAKTTVSDTILKDRAYEIARNCNYDGYQRPLASTIYKFFDKKTRSGGIVTSKAGIIVNEKLAELKIHK